jgi:hypothetical protein
MFRSWQGVDGCSAGLVEVGGGSWVAERLISNFTRAVKC